MLIINGYTTIHSSNIFDLVKFRLIPLIMLYKLDNELFHA